MDEHKDDATACGEITDVFAHRFVLRTAAATILADLGPRGGERVALAVGDSVEIFGRLTPSELKVTRLIRSETAIDIEHGKRSSETRDDVDPQLAHAAAAENGLTVLALPRRKPKHFEVLGRDDTGDVVELHIDRDGELRKSKPGDAADPKWTMV